MTTVGTPEEMSAKIAADLIARVFDSASRAVGKSASKTLDALKVIYDTSFQPYVAAQYFQYFEIKTLVSPLKPIAIEEIFESPYLSVNKERRRYPTNKGLTLDEFAQKVNERSRVIITAIAGSGKSVLLKYLFIRMVKQGSKFVPIFLELRHLNDLSETNLETLIYGQILAASPKFKREQFLMALRMGKFCFMFDGFDELRPDLRVKIKTQIDSLSSQYPENAFVVTSRPDDEFLSWTKYTEYSVHPFNKTQAISLLEKIPFEAKVKSKLITRIRDGLYDTHRDFLSNPLLAGMMLLTFESSYDIPSKRYVFYQRAFQALIEKHDASKSYRRDFATQLDQIEFSKVFSAFCVYSYLEKEYSFTADSAAHYAEFAFNVIGHSQCGADLVHDLEKCVCMLVKDGDRLSFLHRSFQEYFAANFIVFHARGGGREILSKCVDHLGLPNAAAMLCLDIDRDFVEFEYLLPILRQFERDFESVKDDPAKTQALFFTTVTRESIGVGKNNARGNAYMCTVHQNDEIPPYFHLLLFLIRSEYRERLLPHNWYFAYSESSSPEKVNKSGYVVKTVREMCEQLIQIRCGMEQRMGQKQSLVSLLTKGAPPIPDA